MKKIKKCSGCGNEIIGKDFITRNKLLYHKECKTDVEFSDFRKLTDYIKEKLEAMDAYNPNCWSKVAKYIQRLCDTEYPDARCKITHIGILYTLKYYYDVLGNEFPTEDIERAINIVPYYYNEARDDLKADLTREKNIKDFDFDHYGEKWIEVKFKSKSKPKPELIDISAIDVDD
jgi:hypothetical protein